MSLKGVGVALAQAILGTTTNNNASAGFIGEFITSTVAVAGQVTLTTATTANVTSISLTAGDWDVSGVVDYTFAATTSYTSITAGISLTSATLATQPGGSGLGTDPNSSFSTPAQVPTALPFTMEIAPVRVSIAATTTVFLVTQATFTVAGLQAYGTIRARRVR